MSKVAQNQYPIHSILQQRWSPRAFSSQPVAQADLMSLLEAARWTPSASNQQPWSFIVTHGGSEAFITLRSVLRENNFRWAQFAPILILTAAASKREDNSFNPYAWYDLGQAVAHLTFEAGARGIFVHQMAGFDREKAAQLFHLPANFEAVTVVAIGYLGDLASLSPDLQERETAVRQRKPLDQIAFRGDWQLPLNK